MNYFYIRNLLEGLVYDEIRVSILGGENEWVARFVGFLESRATFVLMRITLLVFLKEIQFVSSEAGTKYLSAYKLYVKYMFQVKHIMSIIRYRYLGEERNGTMRTQKYIQSVTLRGKSLGHCLTVAAKEWDVKNVDFCFQRKRFAQEKTIK
jgi:hypothetical protein